jgi:pimeloyl-ACP methyl ester carboxylesterase
MVAPEPFRIEVAEAVLDDLDDRLDRHRGIQQGITSDWSHGVPTEFLQRVVDHWRNGYDWRAEQDRLNAAHHFLAEIDGTTVHYVHERGKGPNPLPLVLTHGWPWTFDDYRALVGPLTDPAAHDGDPADSFDLVIPSLPGFAFSTPTRPDLNFWKAADVWVRLMVDGLGYDRFAAHGCDMGALLTSQLAHKHAERLVGIHTVIAIPPMVFSVDRPWADMMGAALQGLDGTARDEALAMERRYGAHIGVQCLSPLTLAHGLHDSPVGLAAWLVEPRYRWSDCGGDIESCFSLDDLITTVMLYWVTGSFPSAVGFYSNAWRYQWEPSHQRLPLMEAPTGITWFGADMQPAATEAASALYNLVYTGTHERGGHFAPVEQPIAVVEDIRATFRELRP